MDLDSDNEPLESPTDNALRLVNPEILAELSHLDLSGRVTIQKTKVVRAGAYGDVSRAICILQGRGKIKVAIKMLRFYLAEDIQTLFEKEIYVWSKLNHPNILALLGYTFDGHTGYPQLVSEWLDNGSAGKYVCDHPQCDLMRLIIGMAEGLSYLHDNGVVHSDIKPDNILVSSSGDPLLCDFGCSRIIAGSRSLANMSSGPKGTTRYLAFELVALSGDFVNYSSKTDELLARKPPYDHLRETQVYTAIVRRILPSLPSNCESEFKELLWKICMRCWTFEPAQRANIAWILAELRDALEKKNEPAFIPSRGLDGEQSNALNAELQVQPHPGTYKILTSANESLVQQKGDIIHVENVRSGSQTSSTVLNAINAINSPSTSTPHYFLASQTLPNNQGQPSNVVIQRPSDDIVEDLFNQILINRDYQEIPSLSLDQKWYFICNDEQLRRKEEKAKEDFAKTQRSSLARDSPEWYLKKFIDRTITSKQVVSLLVALRTDTVNWFRQFLDMQGIPVLAHTLNNINRKGENRLEADIALEYGILKCLWQITNTEMGMKEALKDESIFHHITAVLGTSQITSRKVVLEILITLCHWGDNGRHELVISALEALSLTNGNTNPYSYWFLTMETSLLAQGQTRTLDPINDANATYLASYGFENGLGYEQAPYSSSSSLRKSDVLDSSLIGDYADANLLLIQGILEHIEDASKRIHHRKLMEATGLNHIKTICRELGHPKIEAQLASIELLWRRS